MRTWLLPLEWEWKKLDVLCKTTSGGTPSRGNLAYFAGDIPWIKSGELNDGFIIDSEEHISIEAIESSNAKIFPKGTLLIAMYGATVGKLGILDIEAATNQAICAIFPYKQLNRDYLFWFLKYYRKDLIGASFGGAQPNISQTVIRNIEVPIPFLDNIDKSLEIQNRIALRIENTASELAEARRLHEKIVADTNRLMDAVLAEVFPNPDNDLETGWILRTVEELSNDPQYGYTASANKQSDGVRFLRITDIQNGNVDWSKVPSCECTKRDIDQYGLRDGDIVFARTGATTGKTFLVRHPPEAIFASYLIRLQITRYASPDFVYWFFQSPYYWRQIIPRGGAQPNMNAQLLKKVRIPVPESSALQSQIVERILSVKNDVDGMQKKYQETSALLANLENSLLAQAFRGEL